MPRDVSLNCDEDGWGVAPIIGVDYKLGNLNLGAKYEFKTSMRLTNVSANSASADNLAQLSRIQGRKQSGRRLSRSVDIWRSIEFTPQIQSHARLSSVFRQGCHSLCYRQKLLGANNMEYLWPEMEWDITKRYRQVSAGNVPNMTSPMRIYERYDIQCQFYAPDLELA